jgi:hypothetical protein
MLSLNKVFSTQLQYIQWLLASSMTNQKVLHAHASPFDPCRYGDVAEMANVWCGICIQSTQSFLPVFCSQVTIMYFSILSPDHVYTWSLQLLNTMLTVGSAAQGLQLHNKMDVMTMSTAVDINSKA